MYKTYGIKLVSMEGNLLDEAATDATNAFEALERAVEDGVLLIPSGVNTKALVCQFNGIVFSFDIAAAY